MKRRPKPYTTGQCVDDVNRALSRLFARTGTSRSLYAVIDCVMRLQNMKPRSLRIPADGAE